MVSPESPDNNRWQFSLRSLFAVVTLIAVVLAFFRSLPPSDRGPHEKKLVHNVFYLGMSADEVLSKLPPGFELDEIAIYYDYGPNGPTRAQIQNDPCYCLAKPDSSESIPLFFSEARRLVKVGVAFDEEKFITLYQQRVQTDESGK